MANRTFLLLDVNYLGYRSLHSTGKLAFREVQTGVLYGIFRDILTLQDLHATSRVVFCFDYGESLREKMFPAYKEKRKAKKKEYTPKEKKQYQDLQKQLNLLRTEYLPYVGFRNVFYQDGYEADDVIASIVKKLPPKNEAVIVSADKDLYQLLRPGVVMWNPTTKVCMTEERFTKQFEVVPKEWHVIKAIAGCETDDVPGITGVGDKTAAQYINGVLPKTHKKYDEIKTWVSISRSNYVRNLQLVKLPFTGCNRFKLVPDEIDRKKWRKLMDKLGMRSLRDKSPVQVGFGFKKIAIKQVGHNGT